MDTENKIDIENDLFFTIDQNRVREDLPKSIKEVQEIHYTGRDTSGRPVHIHDQEHKLLKPLVRELMNDELNGGRIGISLAFIIIGTLVFVFVLYFVYDIFFAEKKEIGAKDNVIEEQQVPNAPPVVFTGGQETPPVVFTGGQDKQQDDNIINELTKEHYELINNNLGLSCEGEIQAKEQEISEINFILKNIKLQFDDTKAREIIFKEKYEKCESEKITEKQKFSLFIGEKIKAKCEDEKQREDIKKLCESLYFQFLSNNK